ncbi:MAG: hypothetical protein RL425_1350 [Pseudomonadota bacterium]
MAPNIQNKRGRKRKVVPFFSDPESERIRVERCLKEGRDPYPKYKHEPCAAELNLRADIEPYIPFELVLALNDIDEDGYPFTSPEAERWLSEAKAKQNEAAQKGGANRTRENVGAKVIAEEADFIRQKRDDRKSKSAVFQWIMTRRKNEQKKCVGRSEFYRQLAASGLWP